MTAVMVVVVMVMVVCMAQFVRVWRGWRVGWDGGHLGQITGKGKRRDLVCVGWKREGRVYDAFVSAFCMTLRMW